MSDLSRSLLNAAREGLSPDAAIAARVRAKIAASVAAGAATATATTVASSATSPPPSIATGASTKAGSTALLLKLTAALLVVGAATVALTTTRDRATDAPHLAMSTANDVDEPRTSERSVAHDSSNAAAPALPSVTDVRRPAVAIDPSAIEIEVPPVAPTAEPVSLSREVELIDLAMASLRKHAPAAALAAIHTFDRETLGRGQMAEEAAAIAIEARCGLQQDVTAALAAFDRAWPSSAQRSRVVTTCFAR